MIHTTNSTTADSGELEHKPKNRDQSKKESRTRTQVKSGKSLPEHTVSGIVIEAAGPWWVVVPTGEGEAVDLTVGEVYCVVSGTVDAPGGRTLVTVGDHVWFVPESGTTEFGEDTGTIIRVEERKTLLSRKAAGKARKEQVLVSNVEQLAIVIAAAQPDYHRRLIDRYLIAADKGDLHPIIIVNKVDLVGGELLQVILDDLRVYYDTLNLDVFFVSTVTDGGMKELAERLAGKSTLMAGQSGVGKTSIINALVGQDRKVGEISRIYQKGKHTTTGAVVIPLPSGGNVVDSPGIREFAIWQLDVHELPYYFEEFTPFAERCKFNPCSHTHEPGCAVKQAVDDGLVEEGRYISYTVLRDEIENA